MEPFTTVLDACAGSGPDTTHEDASAASARNTARRRWGRCDRPRLVTVRLYSPSVLDHLVLSLIDERPAHGFAIAKLLSNNDSLAAVMHVRRPLVYRSLKALSEAGFIRASKTEAGDQGSERTVYRVTARGSREVTGWLDGVVAHPRDARIELLAKFVCRSRRNLSNVELAQRQREVFEDIAQHFDQGIDNTTGAARLVAMWRHESVASMVALLERLERD